MDEIMTGEESLANEAAAEQAEERSYAPDPAEQTGVSEENEALRAEVERLRGEVTRLGELQARSRAELDEFCALFPTVSLASLPDEVRTQVDGGVPLAAAYALFEKREACRTAAGKRSAEQSWRGMNDQSDGEYYSPAEVKSMSQKEVHKNYKKIIESMKHWK
ncbi:MAG: hypothetical protein J6B12_06055 [Clostridia bacterium]|nr:hypothetical protein [Clostridia bacterium]